MTWGNCYVLPWPALDDGKIDAALAEVVRRWPDMRVERVAAETRLSGGEHLTVFFWVPGPLARRIELDGLGQLFRPHELDAHWALYSYDGIEPLPIEVEFDHYPASDGDESRPLRQQPRSQRGDRGRRDHRQLLRREVRALT